MIAPNKVYHLVDGVLDEGLEFCIPVCREHA